MSKNKSLTAHSTVESEFISLSYGTREVLWVRKLITDIALGDTHVLFVIGVLIRGCIWTVQNYLLSDRRSHIEVKFNLMKYKVWDKSLDLNYVKTGEIAAYVLKKVL